MAKPPIDRSSYPNNLIGTRQVAQLASSFLAPYLLEKLASMQLLGSLLAGHSGQQFLGSLLAGDKRRSRLRMPPARYILVLAGKNVTTKLVLMINNCYFCIDWVVNVLFCVLIVLRNPIQIYRIWIHILLTLFRFRILLRLKKFFFSFGSSTLVLRKMSSALRFQARNFLD